MYAIRPYLFLAVVAIIIGVVMGTVPAIWMAAAAAACMLLNSSASLVDQDLGNVHHRVVLSILKAYLGAGDGAMPRG